ncbi:MAG: UMP kinase [Eubacteriales bacterium]|nr:UMP kinase [Eubacteriales bacterium]
MSELKYKRILLKLSGEALAGEKKTGIDDAVIAEIADRIVELHNAGVEVAIVVGGGNFWRGRSSGKMDRTTADHMGMLATVINSLGLQDAIEQKGVPTRVMTAIEMNRIAEPYIRRKAVRHLEKRKIVIFGCGTGNPFFSTDTAAVLRAVEIGADAVLMAKNIDGVYDSDPRKNPQAKMISEITYKEVLARGLAALDATAVALCVDNELPVIVFGMNDPANIMRVVRGEKIGTLIHE